MEKQKKEIVKYDNQFNFSNFGTLKSVEQNVFMAILAKIYRKKETGVVISFDDLRQWSFLIQGKNYTKQECNKIFSNFSEKIFSILFKVEKEDGKLEFMPMFVKWTVSPTFETSVIELNPYFASYFFGIPEGKGFTQFFLDKFVIIKSKYAKTLFRMFHQNFSGKWIIGIDEYRKIMDFPKSYRSNNILVRTKKMLKEIEETGYFSNIELKHTTCLGKGRAIKDLIFTYSLNRIKFIELKDLNNKLNYQTVKEEKTKLNQKIKYNKDGLPYMTAEEEKYIEEKKCPKCGSKVVKRQVTDKTKNTFGQWYEKCENNDKNNQKCDYYKFLDEE